MRGFSRFPVPRVPRPRHRVERLGCPGPESRPHPRFLQSRGSGATAKPGGYRSFMFDMVGTLHQYGVPIPGAAQMLAELQAQRVPFIILTNEDRETKAVLLSKLRAMLGGVDLSAEHLFTASDAARLFFARKLARGWRGSVYAVGEEGLLCSLREVFVGYEDTGSRVLTLAEPVPHGTQGVDFVMVGSVYSDTEAGSRLFQSLEAACAHIRAGAKLLCSCPDDFEVTQAGQVKLGSPGCSTSVLQKITGRGSYALGKPNPFMLRQAWGQMLEHYQTGASDLHFSDALFVGDSLGTDISLAVEHGMDTALVLSGTTQRAELALSPLTPTFVFNSIADVHGAYVKGDLAVQQESTVASLLSSSRSLPESLGQGSGEPASEAAYQSFIFDMDGVIHRCGVLIPGADVMIRELQARQAPFVILTNEDRYTNRALLDKLHAMLTGVQLEEAHIFTCSNSARAYFRQRLARGWRGSVYVIGEEGLISNVQEALADYEQCGILTLQEPEFTGMAAVDYVVVGSVHSTSEAGANYVRSLERACHYASTGAKVLCSCPDDYEVTESGEVRLGSPGPSVRTLQSVTGKGPHSLGKPNPHMLRAAWEQMVQHYSLQALSPRRTESLFVGDSLGTDIRTALEHDIDCALVLSGTTSRDMLAKSPLTPTFVLDSIAELHAAYASGVLCQGYQRDM